MKDKRSIKITRDNYEKVLPELEKEAVKYISNNLDETEVLNSYGMAVVLGYEGTYEHFKSAFMLGCKAMAVKYIQAEAVKYMMEKGIREI